MAFNKFHLILLVCFFSPSVQWHYQSGGPELWAEHYKDCGGKKQSPIDVPSAAKASTRVNFPDFNRSIYTTIPQYIQLQLLEQSFLIKPHYENDTKITVNGGPFSRTYILDHVHFHWSQNDTTGSEHTVDGKQYAMEAHLVHYCSKYQSVIEAMTQDSGLMVMGYLLKIHPNATFRTMDNLTSYFKHFNKDTREINITKPFAFSKLLPPFQDRYVTYNGSLTTPPCFETVCWIVYDTPLSISETNLHEFWNLSRVDSALSSNARPLQERNNRKIVGKKVALHCKSCCD